MNDGHKGKMLAAFLAGAVTTLFAGGYYLYDGPQGRERRKKAEKLVAQARDEILEKMEKAKNLTESVYKRIVDEVMEGYSDAARFGEAEGKRIALRFRERWAQMRAAAREAAEDAEAEVREEVKARMR